MSISLKEVRRQRVGIVVALALAGVVWLWSPALAAADPEILFTDPPIASQYTSALLIRGNGWGPYDTRGEPKVYLFDEEGQTILAELTVEKNYRDCSFFKTGGSCVMDEDDMLLRVLLPAGVQPRNYIVFVRMANEMGAMHPFSIVALPNFRTSPRPIIALTPQSGPVKSYVLLTVGGFPKRSGLILRFDGLKMEGTPVTDADGAIDEYGFRIPGSLQKPGGLANVTFGPGKHELRVDTGTGLFQTIPFTITGKEEPKKEEPADPNKPFLGKPCNPNLPRVWQEGCVDKGQKQEVEVYVPDSKGKPCKEGVAITFQPGCIPAEKPAETLNPFAGKTCDPNLPRVWQEGCVDQKIKADIPTESKKYCEPNIPTYSQPGCTPKEQDKTALPSTPTTPTQAPTICNPLIPTYSQPGCVSPEQKTAQQTQPVTEQKTGVSEKPKPFAGKLCDPNLPRVWQEGCVTKQADSGVSKKIDSLKKIEPVKIEPVKIEPIKLKSPSSDSKTQKDYNEAYQKSIQWDAYKRVLNLGSGIY